MAQEGCPMSIGDRQRMRETRHSDATRREELPFASVSVPFFIIFLGFKESIRSRQGNSWQSPMKFDASRLRAPGRAPKNESFGALRRSAASLVFIHSS